MLPTTLHLNEGCDGKSLRPAAQQSLARIPIKAANDTARPPELGKAPQVEGLILCAAFVHLVCECCDLLDHIVDPLHRVLLPTTEEEWHLCEHARGLETLPFLGWQELEIPLQH